MRSLMTLGLSLCAAASVAALGAADARATTVRFTSNLGTFDVELFDTVTPQTVANFLSYVNAGAYNNTIIHRSEPSFVIQGGGYLTDGSSLAHIPQNAPVSNEFALERAASGPGAHINVRGTIAMATIYGDPNSATNEFFFNLADNSGVGAGPGGTNYPSGLDFQNGGYTTFGTVTGSGMSVIDAIAGLPIVNLSLANPAFGEFPLAGDGSATFANVVTFSSIAVLPEPASTMAAVVGLACVASRRPRRCA